MPCNDLTEILKISLDNDSCLIDYSLKKLTCERAVVDSSLILKILKGLSADEILGASIESISPQKPPEDDTERYLQVKHLQAVQSGLEVLMGYREGKPDDKCVIESINHGPDGTELTARIKLGLRTDDIKSCYRLDRENKA